MPKYRGAEEGDVDGPLGCSLALGMVAAETRFEHCCPASRTHPFVGTDNPVKEQRMQTEHICKMQHIQDYHLGGRGKQLGDDDPRRTSQENGGLADFRYTCARKLIRTMSGVVRIIRKRILSSWKLCPNINSIFSCVRISFTYNVTLHVHVLWPVFTHVLIRCRHTM